MKPSSAALETRDLQGLLDVLAPDVVAISDGGGIKQATPRPVVGADKVARFIVGGLTKNDVPLTVETTVVNGSSRTDTAHRWGTRRRHGNARRGHPHHRPLLRPQPTETDPHRIRDPTHPAMNTRHGPTVRGVDMTLRAPLATDTLPSRWSTVAGAVVLLTAIIERVAHRVRLAVGAVVGARCADRRRRADQPRSHRSVPHSINVCRRLRNHRSRRHRVRPSNLSANSRYTEPSTSALAARRSSSPLPPAPRSPKPCGAWRPASASAGKSGTPVAVRDLAALPADDPRGAGLAAGGAATGHGRSAGRSTADQPRPWHRSSGHRSTGLRGHRRPD